MQGYHTNTEDTGNLGYNLVCYIASRIGWVSLKEIYRYVDMILENCTITFVILQSTYLTKDQHPPSSLVVYSTIQRSTIEYSNSRVFAKPIFMRCHVYYL